MQSEKVKKSDGRKLARGVVIGGVGSIIAMDIAELCFDALDPMATTIVKAYDGRTEDVMSGAQVAPDYKKMLKDEEKKKNVWKRIVRVILLALTTYLVLVYLL